MSSRAMRIVVSLSLFLLVGASVAQAAPGEPGPVGGPPGQVISGRLSVSHGDTFEFTGYSHASDPATDHVLPDMSYWLQTDAGEEVLLEFPGTLPAATPGAYYEVRGQRNGRSFHVSEMKEHAAGKSGGGGGGPKGKTPTSYVGARDMIVIPFTFAGNPTPLTHTTEAIRDRGFGPRSVRTFYEESSSTTSPGLTLKGKNDGTASDKDALPGDVTQTFAISGVATDRCDYTSWATAARNEATAAGWDLSGYEHIVYLHPRLTRFDGTKEVPICSWSGLAQIGGTYSWLNGTISLGVWAHELGHNLTLYHSRTAVCSTADGVFIAVASSCNYEEYGDPFDTMGQTSTSRQYHARNKAHLGWVPSANLLSAVSGQTYTLKPINSAASGLQILQIPRGREYLYVEYRRPSGTFDTFAATDDVVNGVSIRSGPAIATNGNSYLYDTAIYPTTTKVNISTGEQTVVPDFSDAALNAGEGFVDVASGVYVETLSVNPDGTVTVLVRTGVTNVGPDLTGFTGGTFGLPGVPHQAPTAELTDTNKNLGRYRWAWVSCPTTCPQLTNTEGALSGGSDAAPGPSYVPPAPGTYDLELKVWDTSGAVLRVVLRETMGI